MGDDITFHPMEEGGNVVSLGNLRWSEEFSDFLGGLMEKISGAFSLTFSIEKITTDIGMRCHFLPLGGREAQMGGAVRLLLCLDGSRRVMPLTALGRG
jgi:hypothetical protein